MITLRKAADRGRADHGWLKSWHTFSFGDYQDPRQRGFRTLRVMNEDRVEPGKGFGTHPHRDMEILSYVLEGELEHRDSMGNGQVLRPGEFQRMSAGTGVLHSEFNPSDEQPTHFYQVWIKPSEKGLEPGYEQRGFDPAGRRNRLQLVASPEGADGSLRLHQNARVYLADLEPGAAITLTLEPERHAWLQLLRGAVRASSVASPPAERITVELTAGDGASVSDETAVQLATDSGAELLLFDLA